MELSGTDEKIFGRGSQRQKYRTNRKRLQDTSCLAISGVIEQSNNQMGRAGNAAGIARMPAKSLVFSL